MFLNSDLYHGNSITCRFDGIFLSNGFRWTVYHKHSTLYIRPFYAEVFKTQKRMHAERKTIKFTLLFIKSEKTIF